MNKIEDLLGLAFEYLVEKWTDTIVWEEEADAVLVEGLSEAWTG